MYQLVNNGIQCIRIFFKCDKKNTYVYIFTTLLYALFWVLQTISLQWFFDAITRYASNQHNFILVLHAFGMMAIVYLFYHVLDGINNAYPEIFELKLKKYLNLQLFKKISELDVLDFENTKELNRIEKAKEGTNNLVWIGFAFLDIMFYYIAYFIFISWYLFQLQPVLVLCVVFISLPSILSRFIHVKSYRNLEDRISQLRRELDYLEESLVAKKFYKETRLLGITQQQHNKFMEKLHQINSLKYTTEKRKAYIDICIKFLNVIGYAFVLVLLFVLVIQEDISIGAFAAVLASLTTIHRFMNKLIFDRLGWALENFGTVENTLKILNSTSVNSNNSTIENFNTIQLKDVSFYYPESQNVALKNINLTIHKGESIAIVGVNGSGKSTLAKIIAGLYPITRGDLLIDNQKQSTSLLKHKSMIFQNYIKYQMNVKDNVGISDLENAEDINRIYGCLQESGIRDEVNALENDINTMLGREFNGIDLSTGQWQKIAIARGLFKYNDLIILDEPTSAIDPIEERNLYGKFQDICKDKTAILITHRIGSARLTDRILVLKDGELIEDGNHDTLLAKGGEYQRLYQEQSKWY